jgi:hypothetical protein
MHASCMSQDLYTRDTKAKKRLSHSKFQEQTRADQARNNRRCNTSAVKQGQKVTLTQLYM